MKTTIKTIPMKKLLILLVLLSATSLFARPALNPPKIGNPSHSSNLVAGVLNAVDDLFPSVASGATPIVIGSVLTNDTLDGLAVTLSNTNGTPITSGPLSVDANGNLTLAANTPSGNYLITYQICESDTSDIDIIPANCDVAVATVVVLNQILAQDDINVHPTSSVPSGTVPTTVGSVLAEHCCGPDTLNGLPATTSNTDVTPQTAGPLSINVDGLVTVASNTPSGTYTITYQLCETGAITPNCDTAIARVVVLNPIDAWVDVFPAQTSSAVTPTVIGNVTTNDTLNGILVSPSNSYVDPHTEGPLSVNADGELNLSPNTPTGVYPITYTICETNPMTGLSVVPANCDTATVTITVGDVINAVNDGVILSPFANVSVSTSNVTVPGTVLTNDTLNGAPVTTANTDVTVATEGPLSINVDGVITVASGTASGTYTITYTLCSTALTPQICDTATAYIRVLSPTTTDLSVTKTVSPLGVAVGYNVTFTITASNNGAAAATGVIVSDVLPAGYTLVAVVPTVGSFISPIWTIGNLANGSTATLLIVATVTSAGPWENTATISSNVTDTDPGNDTGNATPIVINAINDGSPAIPFATANAGAMLPSVITNDTLNGIPVTLTNSDVTPISSSPSQHLSIDANGIITIASGTPNGSYSITYTLCSVMTPVAFCDTATAYVTVNSISNVIRTSDGTYVDANADGVTNPGDEIQYAIVLTNSGTTALNNITITDVNATVSGSLAILAAGATDSTTFTAVHVITATDIVAAQVNNLATISINGFAIGNATDPTPCTSCNAVAGCASCSSTPINRIGGGLTNIISGKLRLDYDQNGCSTTDPVLTYQKVQMSYGTDMVETFTNTTGDYSFYAGVGTFMVNPVLTNPAYASSTPVSQTITFSTNNNATLTQDFCINPVPSTKDLYISMFPSGNARPGFHAYYYIVYRNNGTLPVTQTNGVMLNFDDSKMDFVSAAAAPSTQTTGVLQWNIVNLLPGETRYIYVVMLINAPTATVPVVAGTILPFSVNIIPTAGDINVTNNSMVFNQVAVNSWDPNAITCVEGASLPPSEIGHDLHYAIDFENTGNFPAEFIVVKIDVNPADYDLSSLQLEFASHAVETKIIGNRVEFFFKNIHLAGPGGHGHILLRIKSKNTLLAGDSVTKNASIFFDYNAPILTNDATTVYNALSANQFEIDPSIAIAPNPTTGNININTNDNSNNSIKSITVYDVQGRILETVLNTNSIDISDKTNGIYFLKITTEIGTKIEKVVKE